MLCLVFASGSLVAIAYISFLLGWWICAIPALSTLWGTTTVLLLVSNRQREQLFFKGCLAKLLTQYKDYPIAGRIALEYFKQSETLQNQVEIDAYLTQQSIEPGNPDLPKTEVAPGK